MSAIKRSFKHATFKPAQQEDSSMPTSESSHRIAILQRALPAYRLSLFHNLNSNLTCQVRLLIGADVPNSKVKSADSFNNLDVRRLPTSFLNLGKNRQIINHRTLIARLSEFNPDVILCEGESNILSYIKAIWYRRSHPGTGLIHWSLGGLPGSPITSPLKRIIKRYLLSRFDTFVVYSSYGRDELLKFGCPNDRIHVAVNVSDTKRHLVSSRNLVLTKEQARQELCLPMKFTVLYAGALDSDKRLETLIKALADTSAPPCNLVVLGDGPLLSNLKSMAFELGLRHAFFLGRVSWELMAKYYRAGNVFVLPGRGGMVMSEAMAHGLPVIVHQADGTEFDLVQDGVTGYRVDSGSPKDICAAIKKLWNAPEEAAAMGAAGQKSIEKNYTLDSMVQAIQAAANQAIEQRRGSEGTACG